MTCALKSRVKKERIKGGKLDKNAWTHQVASSTHGTGGDGGVGGTGATNEALME